MSFVIRKNDLFYVGCFKDDVDEIEELIYSTSIKNAEKFKTLEDIDEATSKHDIQGYSVGVGK